MLAHLNPVELGDVGGGDERGVVHALELHLDAHLCSTAQHSTAQRSHQAKTLLYGNCTAMMPYFLTLTPSRGKYWFPQHTLLLAELPAAKAGFRTL